MGVRLRPKYTGPSSGLAISEVMTILILFQSSRVRDFKNFYLGLLCPYYKSYFPKLPCYAHFIRLMQRAIFPLCIFTQLRAGRQTGIYYIDSSCLPVCHIKRSSRHKTFDLAAEYGHTSVGWFFGLKLHLVINDRGELIAFKITRGNRHDSKEAVPLLKKLKGLAFGDKGYLGKKIFEELFAGGLKLITRSRKNMKNKPVISRCEKQLLNKRGMIETVIGHLKHCFQVWHTRHRSIMNALTHLIAALAAYTLQPLQLGNLKMLANCTK
jgi:Transposase DDE domain